MTRLNYNTHDTEPGRAWLTQALCVRPDMAKYRHLFFPHPGEKAKAEAAKQICASCPVRIACLEDALAEEGGRGHENRHGIRGGMAPRARRNRYEHLRRMRQQEEQRTEATT
ncbi:WhiB family transcriptional regulator [Streptomyces asoensis]|uniref:WhiB family transcriptional regulator n=1 Tax=Streptomyces asoensis TaxID=249586 RepID=A0A6M4X2A2_9ACTN|nr:WhiB family transcriptional regulator [Streptomyces asoensis]QJT04396.1 WhiB family transcriptional regulator [Streptomyces asoensis]